MASLYNADLSFHSVAWRRFSRFSSLPFRGRDEINTAAALVTVGIRRDAIIGASGCNAVVTDHWIAAKICHTIELNPSVSYVNANRSLELNKRLIPITLVPWNLYAFPKFIGAEHASGFELSHAWFKNAGC